MSFLCRLPNIFNVPPSDCQSPSLSFFIYFFIVPLVLLPLLFLPFVLVSHHSPSLLSSPQEEEVAAGVNSRENNDRHLPAVSPHCFRVHYGSARAKKKQSRACDRSQNKVVRFCSASPLKATKRPHGISRKATEAEQYRLHKHLKVPCSCLLLLLLLFK